MTAAVLLFAVLALVVLTNFSERNNANKINTAIASIYQDRLVVEGYIFDHARLLENIDNIVEGDEGISSKKILIGKELEEISRLNALYAKTLLTPKEETSFANFTRLCSLLGNHVASGQMEKAKIITAQARDVLHTLSGIQMEEAKAQMDNVNKMSSYSSIMSQFELGVLIVIAVLVQVLVFSSRTMTSIKYPNKVHLN